MEVRAITLNWLATPKPSHNVLIAVTILLPTAGALASGAPAHPPYESRAFPAARVAQVSGFSTTGRITRIIRNTSRIVVLCDKAHWGVAQPPYGIDRYVHWPANTRLILKIPFGAAITIDGKKVGFDQLAVGQTVAVQYSLFTPGIFCAAQRIDGWTAMPSKTLKHER